MTKSWLSPGWLEDWDPDDPAFWESRGKKIAWKNLLVSIPALHIGFAVWLMWSAVVTNLNEVGYGFTVDQLFWLSAVAGLTGATWRIPNTFFPSKLGGRLTHILTVGSLFIPVVWLFYALQDPNTSWETFMVIGALAGFGGGNFSSSMSNISSFFPTDKQGLALGLNAGLGNLGVSTVQFVTPFIIGAGFFGALAGGAMTYTPGKFNEAGEWVTTVAEPTKEIWLQNAPGIWIVPLVIVFLASITLMNSIHAFSLPLKEQFGIFKLKHTWVMTWLYTFAFGSFIGYSAAFPLALKVVYGGIEGAPDGLSLQFAFIGPLIGALTRPVGGWISDRVGGAKVTMVAGAVLLISTLSLTLFTSPPDTWEAAKPMFYTFLGIFLLMFAMTGFLNGSTYRMIGVISQFTYRTRGPALGWTAAVAAYGAFVIPKVFGTALEMTNSVNPGLFLFAAFYAVSLAICYWFYLRPGAAERGV